MKVIVNPKYAGLTDFIVSLPSIFNRKGEVIYQGRNEVKKFHIGAYVLVVKHYKRPNFIQQIAYRWLRPSKACRAYCYALRLEALRIYTPEAVAYIEAIEWGVFADGYFVSLCCNSLPLLPELYEKKEYDRKLAQAFAEYVVELHQKGFLHGDLNLANIFYEVKDNEFRFIVIDINRSCFKSSPTYKECLKNLMRITHRKDLLHDIVTFYADKRGWDAAVCCRIVEWMLHRFEQKRARKYRLKKIFKS